MLLKIPFFAACLILACWAGPVRAEPEMIPAVDLPLRYVHRDGWEIRLPAGYRVKKMGRRVRFRGPEGAQVDAGSWQTRDGDARHVQARVASKLPRKHRRIYRLHGSGEGQLGSLPAALWQFDLGSRTSLDFAADHAGRSYAIKLSAPRHIAARDRATWSAIAHSFVPAGPAPITAAAVSPAAAAEAAAPPP